ncbi:hypothetical protein [Tardiphaga robiniae]|uniref:Uncharacterized protein n=1 Tax=Tardiphaga robiniae TaxID=943830 RepID=A0A7G6TVP5_9BRAD|nr:hypothetical protein [Tardiphaga robiniae]QND70827.1 hypothetical protein HB776_05940 [Tardiphaga robiniae]
MTSKIVWRYDSEDFSDDQIITSRGDHIVNLKDGQLEFEKRIRAVSVEWERIRRESLYVWRDEAIAKKLWKKDPLPTHLYMLEIQLDDHERSCDVSFYSIGADSVLTEPPVRALDFALKQFITEAYQEPRVEFLVKKAKVIKKVHDSSEKKK